MPLVKTSGVVGNAAAKIRKTISDNKVPLGLAGTAGGLLLAKGYLSRSKERAREEALVNDIVSRNLQKQAAFLPFMKALGSGVKSMASGVGGGLKTGVKGMATSFGNAGFKGVENGINTAGKWTLNTGRNMMGRMGQLGQNMMNSRAGQWAVNQGRRVMNSPVGQWARGMGTRAGNLLSKNVGGTGSSGWDIMEDMAAVL